MKKFIVALMISFFGIANAQETTKDLVTKEVIRVLDSINKSKINNQSNSEDATTEDSVTDEVATSSINKDSLKATVEEHTMKFESLEEKLSGMGTVLDVLSSIKISGYVQAEYNMYDNWSNDGSKHGVAPTSGASEVTNTFSIRRARVKFTYKPLDGVEFVLCPDFSIDKVSLKDAFVKLNDTWLNTFALTMGQFNRPTYEVEFSSSTREFAERSLITRTLYPSEREVGAKLEADFMTTYNVPLQLQLAVFNGNFGTGAIANQAKDVDNSKDIMARAVYSFSFPSKGLGIDIGAHGYFGNNTVISQTATPAVFTDENSEKFTPSIGDKLKKQWFGAEMQVYYDLLGGMSLKTEYMSGTLSGFNSTDFPSQSLSLFNSNKVRNIQGGYVSLIKNAGKSHQFSIRYDVFDPNTKLAGNEVAKKDDLKFSNWTYGYQYFFNSNTKIMLSYTATFNEQSANAGVGADYQNRDKHDNAFTVRFQTSF